MDEYRYSDGVFEFEGCVSVNEEHGSAEPWRIDYKNRDFFPFLTDPVAKGGTGVKLAFTTNSLNIALAVDDVENETILDVFIDDTLYRQLSLEKGCTIVILGPLAGGFKKIDIWLDPAYQFKIKKILINEGSRIHKTPVTQKRWVHYGSSISHSIRGKTPSSIWPVIAAQMLKLHITNLGYGANCVCEPMMGRVIRDLPADYITLKIGINCVDGNLTKRIFRPNVIGFIQIIREKHPATPLAVISPIYCPQKNRETEICGSGYSLPMIRNELKDIVEICKKYGDRNIYYVDGLKVFGPDEIQYMPDGCHPDADGQLPFAENFIKEVFSLFPLA